MKQKYAVEGGSLDNLFSLYEKVEAEDELSGRTTTPVLVGNIWGALNPVYAYEAAKWFAQRMEVSHTITIRAVPNLRLSSTKYFFTLGSRVFNITGVVDTQEAGRKWVIYCVETEGGAR